MKSTKEIGNWGESLAATYLKKKGYKVIDQNVVTRFGEVDLIALKKKQIFFIEIRTRVGKNYGCALESITPKKVNKMRRTAQALLNKNLNWQNLMPFLSVLTIDKDYEDNVKIEFLPNAVE